MYELYYGKRFDQQTFHLEDEEFHHCIRVTRHRVGSKILVTEFEGIIYNGIIEKIEERHAFIRLEEIYRKEALDQSKICIAISPTQQTDRFEWFLEKSVENGIHGIIPIICQRTESKKFRLDRFNKLIRSAAKQSLRAMIPQLSEAIPLKKLFELHPNTPQRFIGHCEKDDKEYLGKIYNPLQDVLVLIGPAGDFTEEEINWAKSNHCKAVSLGDFRLRTETAGLTALQILQTLRNL